MTKIKSLEMAAAVSACSHISVRNSLLGLRQTIVYEPTGSLVRIIVQDYTPTDGERLLRLLELPIDKLEAELKAKGKPAVTPVGHFRLEVCLSDDRQFCALQLFRFTDFRYVPSTDVRFYEGNDVAVIARLL